jgi:hypothetical protein
VLPNSRGEGGKEEAEMEWRDEEIYYISKLKTTRLEKKSLFPSYIFIHLLKIKFRNKMKIPLLSFPSPLENTTFS